MATLLPLQSIGQNLPYEGPVLKSSSLKRLVKLIIQVALSILWIGACFALAQLVFAPKFHAVLVPLSGFIAILSTLFFFQRSVNKKELLPIDAPRGLINIGNDCPFNSLIHLFESVPELAQWLREPVPVSGNAFLNFLSTYDPPQEWLDDLQAKVGESASSPIEIFQDWMNEYRSGEGGSGAEILLAETIQGGIVIKEAFSQFFKRYDFAFENGQRVVTGSRALRLALHRVRPSIQSGSIQEDADEILQCILDVLPNSYKLRIAESYRYDETHLPAVEGLLGEAASPREENQTHLSLSLNELDSSPSLAKMVQNYLDEHTPITRRDSTGRRNSLYQTHIHREFLRVPSYLIFQIKRFNNQRAKVPTLIEIPEEIEVNVGQTSVKYQLVSSVSHHGATIEVGHYTASRKKGPYRYFASDTQIAIMNQKEWEEYQRNAYLFCYTKSSEKH